MEAVARLLAGNLEEVESGGRIVEAGMAQLPDGAARPLLLAHSHVRALSTASGSYSSNTSQENWLCTVFFKIAFVNCVRNN